MNLKSLIPKDWQPILEEASTSQSFKDLEKFISKEMKQNEVFPKKEDIFSAFSYAHFKDVKVVIIGQDPYHDDNQAHGLAFSVQPGVKFPPSLRNILKELSDDLGTTAPDNGFLQKWAEQGILMINAVMTVRAHQANSHKGKGWEEFTDQVIRQVSANDNPVIFVLWGAFAQKKKELIDLEKNYIIESAHPSPLSARRGFFGSKPFSKINKILEKTGQKPINWQLPSSMLF